VRGALAPLRLSAAALAINNLPHKSDYILLPSIEYDIKSLSGEAQDLGAVFYNSNALQDIILIKMTNVSTPEKRRFK
jgi:hypothetical protein